MVCNKFLNSCYAIQNVGLFLHYTAAQNVAVVPQLLGWHKDKIDQRAKELLDCLLEQVSIHNEKTITIRVLNNEGQQMTQLM
ncbi:hypothetical protein [uncultured Microscilla sp.]|uniref:hypothetical protein n=1 Tax=uncultured Microscilla sp. TaxID=432653 RepID=UPI002619EDF8|nr:hypothetical protein [uncultured Microscilla sp.]